MNVRELIQQSYRDAQLIAEEGETATSTQLASGLRLLNRILRRISTDGWKIPLLTEENHTLNAGDNTLTLEGWSEILKAQYFLGNVLFTIKLLDLNTYYNNAIIANNSGIPYIGYAKRTPTGIDLRVFLDASQQYTVQVRGFKILNQVALTDEIDPDSITGFMQDYIGYLLSIDLQIDAQVERISPWLVLKANQYETHFKRLKPIRIDAVNHKMGDQEGGETQAIVSWNLGQGWSP